MSRATTSAYRGLPDNLSRSILKAGLCAEDCGWACRATYTTVPPTVVVRFHRAGFPNVYAVWHDGRFHRSFASTAQRLSYGDLLTVLAEPNLLVDLDPEDPFGNSGRYGNTNG